MTIPLEQGRPHELKTVTFFDPDQYAQELARRFFLSELDDFVDPNNLTGVVTDPQVMLSYVRRRPQNPGLPTPQFSYMYGMHTYHITPDTPTDFTRHQVPQISEAEAVQNEAAAHLGVMARLYAIYSAYNCPSQLRTGSIQNALTYERRAIQALLGQPQVTSPRLSPAGKAAFGLAALGGVAACVPTKIPETPPAVVVEQPAVVHELLPQAVLDQLKDLGMTITVHRVDPVTGVVTEEEIANTNGCLISDELYQELKPYQDKLDEQLAFIKSYLTKTVVEKYQLTRLDCTVIKNQGVFLTEHNDSKEMYQIKADGIFVKVVWEVKDDQVKLIPVEVASPIATPEYNNGYPDTLTFTQVEALRGQGGAISPVELEAAKQVTNYFKLLELLKGLGLDVHDQYSPDFDPTKLTDDSLLVELFTSPDGKRVVTLFKDKSGNIINKWLELTTSGKTRLAETPAWDSQLFAADTVSIKDLQIAPGHTLEAIWVGNQLIIIEINEQGKSVRWFLPTTGEFKPIEGAPTPTPEPSPTPAVEKGFECDKEEYCYDGMIQVTSDPEVLNEFRQFIFEQIRSGANNNRRELEKAGIFTLADLEQNNWDLPLNIVLPKQADSNYGFFAREPLTRPVNLRNSFIRLVPLENQPVYPKTLENANPSHEISDIFLGGDGEVQAGLGTQYNNKLDRFQVIIFASSRMQANFALPTIKEFENNPQESIMRLNRAIYATVKLWGNTVPWSEYKQHRGKYKLMDIWNPVVTQKLFDDEVIPLLEVK